jgi:hypothetical protein
LTTKKWFQIGFSYIFLPHQNWSCMFACHVGWMKIVHFCVLLVYKKVFHIAWLNHGTCWKMWEAIMASMSIVEQMLVVCYNIAWYSEIETSVYVIGLEPIFQTLVHGFRTRTNFLKHGWNLILRLPQTPWHSGRKEEQFV